MRERGNIWHHWIRIRVDEHQMHGKYQRCFLLFRYLIVKYFSSFCHFLVKYFFLFTSKEIKVTTSFSVGLRTNSVILRFQFLADYTIKFTTQRNKKELHCRYPYICKTPVHTLCYCMTWRRCSIVDQHGPEIFESFKSSYQCHQSADLCIKLTIHYENSWRSLEVLCMAWHQPLLWSLTRYQFSDSTTVGTKASKHKQRSSWKE